VKLQSSRVNGLHIETFESLARERLRSQCQRWRPLRTKATVADASSVQNGAHSSPTSK